ncbi:hypothetical protein OUZ56_033836 [Daphnia magna]|uniref:Uncharacterized protein n=1 Tax=Daphnia magna TaxID=35525 RepID=A0ABQ9ZYB6_9CRUS|nr:hypothetical protein OUZ56_033836 [Daphnia magna]
MHFNVVHYWNTKQNICCKISWRNGSAPDSRSGGCVFKSRRDQRGTMAAKWLNSVDIDFGVQFPKLSMRTVHGFVRSLKVDAQDLLGLVAVLDTRNQVARITFTSEAYTSSCLSQHSGIVRTELEGKEVSVVIKDSNIQEKFVLIAGIPQNLDLGVVQTRLKEFGNVIEARWERYRVAEDEVLYPVLATWMIVRMTVTKNIPSYITIGSYRAMVNTNNLETETMECDTATTPASVPLKDNPLKPITKSKIAAPHTETEDQETVTIIMESMEPDTGEIDTTDPDKTKDPLKIPTVPRSKRFKPTLTPQNSKPTSGIPVLKKPNT